MREQPQDDVPTEPVDDPALELVRRMLQAGGRMHKKDVLRLAEELDLAEDALEGLWSHEPKLLDSHKDDKVVTPIGRQRLNNMR
jgi:hypothetical protein